MATGAGIPAIAFGSALNTFQDVARQWPDDVGARVAAAVAAVEAARHAVETEAEARAYCRRIRERWWDLMGGLPGDPAAPRAGGYEAYRTLVHAGVEITALTYESLPGVPVPGLLYRPTPAAAGVAATAGTARRAGVVFLCGHKGLARRDPEFQIVCLDLARHGLVVLAIDPYGQGERHLYADPHGGQPLVPTGTFEHSYYGLQCLLTGGNVCRYFAWDAVRAVDLLAALPGVDPARIGVTGNSGGGAQAVLLMLADDRIAAAMPGTFITDTAALYRTGQTLDAEMCFAGSLAHGLDHADLLAGFAPKPLLVAAAAYDFFPVEGTEYAVEEARRLYALQGAGDQIRLVVGQHLHAFDAPLREAAVRFFTRELTGEEWYERHAIAAVPEAELLCTPTRQVYRDRPGSRGVFELNREFLAAHRRTPPASAGDAAARLLRALGPMPALDATPIRPRYFAAQESDGYTAQQVFFWSEPRIAVAGTLLRPLARPAAGTRTWLVLLPHGTASSAATLAEAIDLARGGEPAFVFDPRGRGAVRSVPITEYAPYDSWQGQEGWTNYVEMLIGASTLGSRVYDVRRAVSFLEACEGAEGRVAIRSHGVAALWGYLAGALDQRVRAARFSALLPSWEEVAETRLFDSDAITAAMILPGVLQHLDLPDLRQCYAGRELVVEAPLRVAVLPERLPLRRNAEGPWV